MNSLNLEAFGFDLLPVETIDGSEVFSLITPFVLLDDEKLDIFVERVGKFIHFFDEGSLIFSLHGHGFSMSSLESYSPWTKLKRHLSSYDVTFKEGQIEHWGEIEKGATALTSYLSALLSVEKWARDQINVPRSRENLVFETKTYLNSWLPNEKFKTQHTSRKGNSGRKYKFDIAGKNKAIDIVLPSINSTGCYLRKAIDFIDSDSTSTLGIIDDSIDVRRAQREINILGPVTPVMPLSRLKTNALQPSLG